MIAHLCTTDIFTVVIEEIDEALQTGKLTLRIADENLWIRLLQEILRAANVSDAFGLEAHKVFHIDQSGSVRYTWLLVLWGDPAGVLPSLIPLLSRKAPPAAPKPPPFALGRGAPASAPKAAMTAKTAAARRAPRAPVGNVDSDDEDAALPELRLGLREGRHNIRKVEAVNNGVTATRTTVRLAHVRGGRFMQNEDPHETIGLHTPQSRFKAVVQPLTSEDGFQARRSGGGSL